MLRARLAASAAGLAGSVLGPLFTTLLAPPFFGTAVAASATHFISLCGLLRYMPVYRSSSQGGGLVSPVGARRLHACERCGRPLKDSEKKYRTALWRHME